MSTSGKNGNEWNKVKNENEISMAERLKKYMELVLRLQKQKG